MKAFNRMILKKGIHIFTTLVVLILLVACQPDKEVFDPAEQFDKEQQVIENYLNSNGIAYEQESEHALFYVIHEQGEGEFATDENWVNVTHQGKVLGSSGNFLEEDSAYYRVSAVIQGWRVLLPLLKPGGRMTMYLPSFYGFGQEATFDGQVPPNSSLEFNVVLTSTLAQNEFEDLAISTYLETEGLEAEMDSITGLKYVILEEGTGDNPLSTSLVNVDYVGSLLTNGQVFDEGKGVEFRLGNLIDGWKILLPNLKEKGTILMFITSEYGYGSEPVGAIPPYSTLVFQVTLNDIL